MTIIEAIKSEKKFKRPTYLRFHNKESLDKDLSVSAQSILANDWEVLVCEKHDARTDIAAAINTDFCATCRLGPSKDDKEQAPGNPLDSAKPEKEWRTLAEIEGEVGLPFKARNKVRDEIFNITNADNPWGFDIAKWELVDACLTEKAEVATPGKVNWNEAMKAANAACQSLCDCGSASIGAGSHSTWCSARRD